jgi:hypothetical protein
MTMTPHTHPFLVDAATAAPAACAPSLSGIERTWNDGPALAGRYAS